MTSIRINIGGTWIQESIPELHDLLKRPLRSGQGFFETMRITEGDIPLLDKHHRRLCKTKTHYNIRMTDFPNPAEMRSLVHGMKIDPQSSKEGKVRWGVVLEQLELEAYTAIKPPCWFFEFTPGPTYCEFDTTPLQLGIYTEKFKRSAPTSIYKLLHETVYDEALSYAKSQGWDDAFILNHEGNIIESVNANLFVWDGNCLLTPPLDDGCVAGIYRSHLMEVCNKAGIRVQESALHTKDLELAKEIILCNALRGVRAVTHFAGKQFSAEFAKKLFALCRSAE